MAFTLSDDAYGIMTLVGAGVLLVWFVFEVVRWSARKPLAPVDGQLNNGAVGSPPTPQRKGMGEPLLDAATNGYRRATRNSMSASPPSSNNTDNKNIVDQSIDQIEDEDRASLSSKRRPRRITSSIPFTFYKVSLAQRAIKQSRASAAGIKINVTGTFCRRANRIAHLIRFARCTLSWHLALGAGRGRSGGHNGRHRGP